MHALLLHAPGQRGTAPHAADTHEFFRLALGGDPFLGTIGADGPLLQRGPHRVSLLHASLAFFECDGVTSSLPDAAFTPGWHAALDGTHPRIPLAALTAPDRERLARTFGLPIWPYVTRRRVFHGSPAFDRLAEWTSRHPADATRYAGASHEPWLAELLRWQDAVRSLPARGC